MKKVFFFAWCVLCISQYVAAQNTNDSKAVKNPRFSVRFDSEFRPSVPNTQIPKLNSESNTQIMNAGIAPNGDLIADVALKPDGSVGFSANNWTRNITVFNMETGQVITNIDVDGNPLQIAASDQYLFVALYQQDKICVINLDDYSVAQYIDIEKPEVMKLSANQLHLFISSAVSLKCTILKADDFSVVSVIENLDFMTIEGGATCGANNRTGNAYLHFAISPDGSYLAVIKNFNSLMVYRAATGQLVYNTGEVSGVRRWSFSGDSKILAYAAGAGFNTVLYRYSLETMELLSEVTIEGLSLANGFENLGLNNDATKIIIPGSSQDAYYNLGSNTVTPLASNRSRNISAASANNIVFISGSSKVYFFDFNEGDIVAQADNSYFGSLDFDFAPNANKAVTFDCLLYEKIYAYDFNSTPDIITHVIDPGNNMEGDAPNHFAVNPQRTKAYIANSLSGNLSIVDLVSKSVEKIIEVNFSTSMVKFTSDGLYAVVTGCGPMENLSQNSNTLIIDAVSGTVIKDIPTVDYSSQICFDANEEYAFITSSEYGIENISVIHLDGANSQVVDTKSWGEIGCSSVRKGDFSSFGWGPKNDFIYMLAYKDNRSKSVVQVIDAAAQTVVNSVELGEEIPLSITFNNDGDLAIVVCWNKYFVYGVENETLDFIVAVEADEYQSFDGCYFNNATGKFYLTGSYLGWIELSEENWTNKTINGSVGHKVNFMDFNSQGHPLFLLETEDGNSIFSFLDEQVNLSGKYYRFDFNENAQQVVLTCPGPDNVAVISMSLLGIKGVDGIGNNNLEATLAPNPMNSDVTVSFTMNQQSMVQVDVYDQMGRKVCNLANQVFSAGNHQVYWNGMSVSGNELPNGIYYCVILTKSCSLTKKLIISK